MQCKICHLPLKNNDTLISIDYPVNKNTNTFYKFKGKSLLHLSCVKKLTNLIDILDGKTDISSDSFISERTKEVYKYISKLDSTVNIKDLHKFIMSQNDISCVSDVINLWFKQKLSV